MKKRFALIGLLTLALTACSGLNFNNNGNDQSNGPNQQTSLTPNDVALNILNSATFFPEVGDKIDLNEYIQIDESFAHTINEYTFTSSNSNVIALNGLSAECKASGYAAIAITGPGINRPTEISFWVGSIAGTYVPDSVRLKDLIKITIGEVDAERKSSVHLEIKEGTYTKNVKIEAFDGVGSMYKNGTPFLQIDFPNGDPKDFAPISQYLSLLGVNADALVPSNTYGLLSYDIAYGLSIKTIFKGDMIEFFRQ